MKATKEQRIADLIPAVTSGKGIGAFVAEFCGKWRIAKRTFENYWAEAQQRHTATLSSQQEQQRAQLDAAATDRLKTAILTREQRMEIASKIARGEAWKVQGELVVPSAGDRMKALDYMSKVDGDYAAKKVETEVTFTNSPITFE